jgi:hypothetical protein
LWVRRRTYSDRIISAILGVLWAWTGIAYHLIYFTSINKAAFFFAAIFLAGAAAFIWAGAIQGKLAFSATNKICRVTGGVFVIYALLVYPLLSVLFGHDYPLMPTFGLPCPTTIFTIGMLCFLATPYPRYVLAAPIFWALVGSQAIFLFGVYQDLGLLVAGIVALLLTIRQKALSSSATKCT